MDLKKARDLCENNGKTVIFCGVVSKKKTFGSKDSALVLHDGGAAFFSKSGQDGYGSWLNLKSLSIEDDKINLVFNNQDRNKEDVKLNFSSKEAKFIFGAIGDILQHVLQKFELERLKIRKLHFQPARPTAASIFSRFCERAFLTKVQLTQSQANTLRQVLQYSLSKLDFSLFEDLNSIFYILIDIVPMIRNVSDIVIPSLTGIDVFPAMGILIRRENVISSITFNGPVDGDLDVFLKGAKEADETCLTSLVFKDLPLTKNNLENIIEVNSSRSLRHLGFQNSIASDAESIFYGRFLSHNMCNSLISLNLDYTEDINLENLMSLIPYIQVLSLKKCGLEISTTFEIITNSCATELKFLNLSENKCSSFSSKCEFPEKLCKLSVSGIDWKKKSFSQFLAVAFRCLPDGFSLDVRNASIEKGDLEKAFKQLESQEGIRVGELIWDNNPIDERFFSFLESCENIVKLSMNGCISGSDSRCVSAFSKSIKKLRRLKSLRIAGKDSFKIGESYGAILKYFKCLEQLEILDISNNNLQDAGVLEVAKCLSNISSFKILLFDFNNVASYETYTSFTETFNKKASFPATDLHGLTSNNKMTNEQYYDLTKKWRLLCGSKDGTMTFQCSSDPKAVYPKPPKNPMDISSSLFFYVFDPDFPEKITNEDADVISKMRKPTRTPYKNAGKNQDDSSEESEDDDKKKKKKKNKTQDSSDDDEQDTVPKKKKKNKAQEESSDEDTKKNIPKKKSKYSMKSNWDNQDITPIKKRKLNVFGDDDSSNDDSIAHSPAPKLPKSTSDKKPKGRRNGSDSSDDNLSSDDESNSPLPKMKNRNKVKQVNAPSLNSDDESNSSEEEEDTIEFDPKDPDWSYPLRYVPCPSDTGNIVRELGEKYSLGSLLTAVKRN